MFKICKHFKCVVITVYSDVKILGNVIINNTTMYLLVLFIYVVGIYLKSVFIRDM